MKTLTLVAIITAALSAALFAQSLEVQLQRAEQKEVASGNVKAAIDEYKKIVDRAGKDRAVAAKALLRMAEAHQKLGDVEAQKIYQQIVEKYSDQQAVVSTARARLKGAGASAAASDRVVWSLPDGSPINLGRVSPDGRYIAYTGGPDLMVRELATGMSRSVAHFASGRPGFTAWSPDGRRLAFEFSDGSGTEIRSINVDGSGLHTALPGVMGWARVLDFFPDGNRVLCSRNQNGDSMVFWVNVNDGSTQDLVLRKGPGGSGWPRLSPDGRYVALRNSPGLSLLATDGSGETVISRNGGDVNAAGWTADGSRLLFIRQQNERTDLWAAPILNGKPIGPAAMVHRDYGSSNTIENHVTRDGSLYYVKFSASGNDGEVYTASADFATGKLLTQLLPEFSSGAGMALWSPDGKSLAYTPNGGSSPALLIRSVETGQTRDVAPKLQRPNISDWSPDGQKFAAMGGSPQGQGVFLVDVQTGDVQTVMLWSPGTIPATIYDDPHFSPDGRKLYYRRRMRPAQTVEYAVMEHDLVTGQARVVLTEDGLSGIRPSPDGRFLAYGTVDEAGSKDTFIRIRPVGAGETREVRILSSQASLCHPLDWLKDASALVYHCDPPQQTGGEAVTWILPMADLKPRKLDLGFSEVMASIHPDGKRIAFSVRRSNATELHVLENFLPAGK